ncbi:hypothetical protein F5883DRAFT_583663 [Diaporthe sp. PMI_573]|nr:hypothetical protein F5883DRAFT_583663 [Diaporthaceae sp. PMI_573]
MAMHPDSLAWVVAGTVWLVVGVPEAAEGNATRFRGLLAYWGVTFIGSGIWQSSFLIGRCGNVCVVGSH